MEIPPCSLGNMGKEGKTAKLSIKNIIESQNTYVYCLDSSVGIATDHGLCT